MASEADPKEARARPRLESIECLRGLAAMSVAWFHFTNGGGLLPDGWLKSSGRQGWLGVEAFFVISGFIIPYSMHRAGFRFPQDCGRFVLKRLVRIEPPYVAAIALAVAAAYMSAALPGFRGAPVRITPTRVLLHLGYLVTFSSYSWLNPAFWTLALEFQFYLLAAVTFPVLAHRSTVVRLGVLAVMCGLSLFANTNGFVFHFGPFFAMGVLTFHKAAGLATPRQFLLQATALGAFTILNGDLLSAGVGIGTALIIAFARIPRFAPLAFLGTVSYSLYLVHVPIGGRVVNLGARFAHSLPMYLLTLGAAVIAALCAAYLMHRCLELPAQRWSSTIRYGRDAA